MLNGISLAMLTDPAKMSQFRFSDGKANS